jgi:hypothetical protein
MINENDIIIDDDLLSVEEQEKIKFVMCDENFPWFLGYEKIATSNPIWADHFKTITPNIQEYLQFVHAFVVNGQKNSDFVNDVLDPFLRASKKYGFDDRIIRIKSNFCTKVQKNSIDVHQSPHVDTKIKHWVMIYYVNDSDGDTFIFNEKLEHPNPIESVNTLTIKQRIKPKQGRVVLFDGAHLHAGSHPSDANSRLVINYVFPK